MIREGREGGEGGVIREGREGGEGGMWICAYQGTDLDAQNVHFASWCVDFPAILEKAGSEVAVPGHELPVVQ